MDRPLPPRPEQFGLTAAQAEASTEPFFRPNGPGGLTVVAVVVLIVGERLLSDKTPLLLLLFVLPFTLFGGMMAATILALVENKVAAALSRTFRQRLAYKHAQKDHPRLLKEYEVWQQRRAEDFWRGLSGLSFERELARLFREHGWKVEQTKHTGDGGVDLIVHDGTTKTIVQCKAHNKKIAINTAREMAACLHDFKADRAIIACLEGVTKPVKDYIATKPITVLDVKGIVEMQRQQPSTSRE